MHIESLITTTAPKAPLNEMMGGKCLLRIPIWEEFANDEMVYTAMTPCKENLIVINLGSKKYDDFFRKREVSRFFNKL
jgi:hypothetical protein